jgi:hypothetical protein
VSKISSVDGGRGKLVVALIMGLAVGAAGFAWWWNYAGSRKALEFYGAQGAHLIRTAPTVEILVLAAQDSAVEGESSGDFVTYQGKSRPVSRRIDISRAPGLIHARTALLDDASYANQPLRTISGEPPSELIRFSDGRGEALLAFSFPERIVWELSSGKGLQLVPKTAEGWRAFISRHLQVPAPSKTSP